MVQWEEGSLEEGKGGKGLRREGFFGVKTIRYLGTTPGYKQGNEGDFRITAKPF